MSNYATVTDIQNLKRSLTSAEQTRAEKLIPIICSLIRYEAKKTGRDFDQMIYESELVPVIDDFEGNGTKTEFILTNAPQGDITITVDGIETTDYEVSGRTVTFNEAPTGEILITYVYRALADVAKGVVCDVVIRELNTPDMQLPATSYSEAAGGVSQSYSLPNSSGSIKLWPSDLKALGLKRQMISSLDLMKPRR